MAHNYRQAVSVLPAALRDRALMLPEEQMARVEEVRLRVGRPPALVLPEGERPIPGTAAVEREELDRLVEIASRWSVHTVLDQLCQGFLALEGGHRLGLCGTAVMEAGRVRALRDLSGADLRVARAIAGAAAGVAPRLRQEGRVCSALILAPPGAGKTTLLRDLIRTLSDGGDGPAVRVGVADERGELAACWRGKPQMELGERTDVLTGCPKAVAIPMLLRGMNPQVIAVDEITAPEDVRAMEQAAGCGVALLATAHGCGREDLERRELYRDMMRSGVFRRLVTIRVRDGVRETRVEEVT